MTAETLNALRRVVRDRQPLVHCVTNPISIQQCANGILAVGARPIMAEHPDEVAEITASAQALVLNLGNITDVRMQAMPRAARAATDCGLPIVLDAVGVACSALRRDFARSLLERFGPAVLKGNYSEIQTLYDADYRAAGVDADAALTAGGIAHIAAALARRHHAVIMASGKADLITDGTRLLTLRNGTPQLSTVTGTGCLLGALCGCYSAVGQPLDAVTTACAVLAICGELAETPQGSGSFLVRLMDALSTVSDESIAVHLNLEETTIEQA